MRKAKPIYFELAVAKGVSHRHLHFGRPKGRQSREKTSEWEKGKAGKVCPDWRLLAWGSCRQAN